MEGVGTLPCAPEIPDCVEQVRAGRPQAPPHQGVGAPPAAPLPFAVFLPWLRLSGVGLPEPPLRTLWLQSQERVLALARWLSRSECRPVHQNVVGLIPGWGTYGR